MAAARILFAGTPDFARASLDALIGAGYSPITVLTQPDRPAGRGRKLTASPVKMLALEHGIPLLQPVSLRDAAIAEELRALEPELMIVAAYGLILPRAVLAIPAMGGINVHASLLPRWRGAAPIEAALIAGDRETGISLMQMDAGLDTGPVYCSQALPIGDAETAGELHERLAALGADLLVDSLPGILKHTLTAQPQDDAEATYAPKVRKEDAMLDWRQPAAVLARRVRAYNPDPGAWFSDDGDRVKCWRAEAVADGATPAGSVVAAGRDGIDVACGDGALRMLELQRPGRRRVTAVEFQGQRQLAGKRFD